jgi:hypothetical protein
MRFVRPVVAALAALLLFAPSAFAKIVIEIDKSAQRMTVSQDGAELYVWPVSTGARGYDTPGGEFKPFRMEKDHFSREWDDAPMPNSIFFTARGHAIHGTEHTRNIGRPVSHGCVRLDPENARVLFSMVKAEGMNNVKIVLFGPTGSGGPAMVRRAPAQRYQQTQNDDDVTGAVPRRVVPEYGYRSNDPWQRQPDPYERTYRAVQPPTFFGGRPFGWN